MKLRLQGFAVLCLGSSLILAQAAADEPRAKAEEADRLPDLNLGNPAVGCVSCHTPNQASLLRFPNWGFPNWGEGKGFDTWSRETKSASSFPTLNAIDDKIRGHLKIPPNQGLLVSHVPSHSPAWLAGLRDQDILLILGGTPLASPRDLTRRLKNAGERPLALMLLRAGETKTIRVQPTIEIGMGPIPSERPTYAIGVVTSPVGPLLRSQLKLPKGQGLTIRDIDVTGPANKVKLAVGDILLELNGNPLDSEQTLFGLIQMHGEKPVVLEVIHEGARSSITLTPVQRKVAMDQGKGSSESAGRAFAQAESVPRVVLNRGGRGLNSFEIFGSEVVIQENSPKDETPQSKSFRLYSQPIDRSISRLPRISAANDSDPVKSQALTNADPVAKRLDDMSTQIDSLRKAVDELARAIKEKK